MILCLKSILENNIKRVNKIMARLNPFIISSPEPKVSVRPSTFSIISSETTGPIEITTGPIEIKFHMGEQKFVQNGPGQMTKMAATPIYGKNPLKVFSRTRRLMNWGLGM